MALRSLVDKLRGLPLRVPGSGAFTPKPKDDPWSKISAALADPTKYASVEEMVQTVRPLVQEKTRLQWEKSQKLTMVVNTSMAVTAIVGSVVMGYKVSSLL